MVIHFERSLDLDLERPSYLLSSSRQPIPRPSHLLLGPRVPSGLQSHLLPGSREEIRVPPELLREFHEPPAAARIQSKVVHSVREGDKPLACSNNCEGAQRQGGRLAAVSALCAPLCMEQQQGRAQRQGGRRVRAGSSLFLLCMELCCPHGTASSP